ncbi:hypothetical protein [Anaerobaca lacustris]|uniref:Uncharacterized protein n=1 Tax=Anaerobaca lacustris TaxID=3044600 RepID=A0AAW6U1N3_9BACT|nr:hypothetical protein [Sedimentisphaerales bacterium M17dextr]
MRHAAMATLINPYVFLLSLRNYTMTYHNVTPLEEPYCNRSPYSEQRRPASIPLDGQLNQRVQNTYFEEFKLDVALLKEALSPSAGPPDTTLAEQVFGGQARQQKIGLGHLANVLYERAVLHKKHLRDIDHRLTQCLDRLSVLKMHFPLDGGRPQQQLEKLIIELERQRHEEEIAFWKDSADIRQQLFENATTYGAARRRKDMLYDVEAEHV